MDKSDNSRSKVALRSVLTICLVAVTTVGAEPGPVGPGELRPVFIEPGPQQRSVLHADGRAIEVETQTVWRSMCGSDMSALSVADLEGIAAATRAARAAREADSAPGVVAGASVQYFDLQFDLPFSVPTGAREAFAQAEQFIESQFTDPVTVVIDVNFASMGSGVLGATGSNYTNASYMATRAGLQADMDSTDSLQDYLPTGTSIAVRYNAHSASASNETRVWATLANYRATIGSAYGYAAYMTFNTDFSWDYSPPAINSGTHSFQDVLIHEVGHALGFTSAADFRTYDIEMLDLYRFQMTDGDGTDFNPDTLEEFTTTARMVDRDPAAPLNDDDAVTDLISAEYRMSDGSPSQASHFRAKNPGRFIMDPSLATRETFYPNFFRHGDLAAFDAIGWDYPPDNTACDQSFELACGGVRHYDNSAISNPPNPSYSCGGGALHDGALWFRFVATASTTRLSTCGSREPDSTMAVYEGGCGSLVEIACNEDYSCESGESLSRICLTDLVVGETYYVQVSAATSPARGVYSLELECSCDIGCADVCCTADAVPQAEPDPIGKNRYISMVIPGGTGLATAVRVQLSTLHTPASPEEIPDFGAWEGEYRWVNSLNETHSCPDSPNFPGSTFRCAVLGCDPEYRNWSTELGGEVLHVTGAAVVPSSQYDLVQLALGCQGDEVSYTAVSSELSILTSMHGDVDPLSDGLIVLDVARIVDHLKGIEGALFKPSVHLRPNVPDALNENVGVLDVATAVDATKGNAYGHSGDFGPCSDACPGEAACP